MDLGEAIRWGSGRSEANMSEQVDRRGIGLKTALLIGLGVALGAGREFLFLNLNYQIDHLARATRFSYAHSLFQRWTAGMGLEALYTLKWILALAFMVAMAGLCVVLARVLFGSWKLLWPIAIGFLLFAVLALALHVSARWAPPLEMVSIHLSHMLQYPVALLFILLASWMPRPASK